jgi:uncharacterized membrane protein
MRFFQLFVLVLLAMAARADIPEPYVFDTATSTFTLIKPPVGDPKYGGFGYGINDIGQIVGIDYQNGYYHGFLDTRGVFTTFDSPNALNTTDIHGINNLGQIVGFDDSGGFLDTGGVFTQLKFPSALNATPWGINDSGQIVGDYVTRLGPQKNSLEQGFLYAEGVYSSISVPDSLSTLPIGINNLGQITGEYVDSADQGHGFLYSAGVFTTIDFPGAYVTSLGGINDAGQIVGTYFSGNNGAIGQSRGFFYSAGVFKGIALPPDSFVSETTAYGINNAGQIVGTANFNESMPEPSSVFLLGGCLVGIALRYRIRRLFQRLVILC